MKIIDALNKIASGEEFKFRINKTGDIYSIKKYQYLLDETDDMTVKWLIDEEWLNYEITIIEEDNKIKKLDIELASSDDMLYKINEIIDYINKE